jgi:alkylation response protein AidB-like acyl-CoA dehydrogenase
MWAGTDCPAQWKPHSITHWRSAANDVTVGAIEHKMGINASSTCVLNFGENGQCLGVPVGGDSKLNQGMSQMFRMMNSARILVGIQGVSVASSEVTVRASCTTWPAARLSALAWSRAWFHTPLRA